MKKVGTYLTFSLLLFFMLSTNVFATSAKLNIGCEQGMVDTFRIIGYALYLIKILVPILLIITGSIDVFKAILNSEQDNLMKEIKTLIKKAIAGIIIFLLPTLINFTFEVITENSEDTSKYDNLQNCLYDPGTCEVSTNCSE